MHYPFQPEDIELRIFIYRHGYQEVPIQSLSCISQIEGKLEYDVRQADPIVLEQIHEETYEEAIKTLRTECPSVKILDLHQSYEFSSRL